MNLRIAVLSALIFLGLFVIGFRAYRLQVSESKSFLDRALQNQTRVEEIPAPRGKLLDRRGRVLAESRKSIDVYLLDPRRVPRGGDLERLGTVLGLSTKELVRKLPRRRRAGYYLPTQLKEEIGQRAYVRLLEEKIHLPSIVPREVVVRHYLYETLACHLFGRVGRIRPEDLDRYMSLGYSPNEPIGVAGLERKYQELLRGKRGIRSILVDALGWPKGEKLMSPAMAGSDVMLTIDLDLQLATERALGSRQGSIAVVDPASGDILALASAPRFDPNHFNRKVSAEEWSRLALSWTAPLLNRATEASYQPGSTFKVLVALAALRAGVDPEETVNCTGQFEIGHRIAKCWKKQGHGKISMVRALAHSCNVYFYTMGLRAGIDNIQFICRSLGLGKKTGIAVGGEIPGVIPGPDWRRDHKGSVWTKGDTVNVSIGQGEVMVTPLQMARVMGAIENQGVLMKPRLVSRVLGESSSRTFAPREMGRLEVPTKQRETVLEGMRWAVSRGTAARTRIRGLDIYGKTGSAQNPVGDTHAWFIGVMRAPGGSLALAVCLENAGGGGKAAAPVAKKVFQAALEAGWKDPHRDRVALSRVDSATSVPVSTSSLAPSGISSVMSLTVHLTPLQEVEEVPDVLAIFDPGGGESRPATEVATGAPPGVSSSP
jgi:penicillin-binding protein 2